MTTTVRLICLGAVIGLYLLLFRGLEGYWPLLGLALCVALYVGVTKLLETWGLRAR